MGFFVARSSCLVQQHCCYIQTNVSAFFPHISIYRFYSTRYIHMHHSWPSMLRYKPTSWYSHPGVENMMEPHEHLHKSSRTWEYVSKHPIFDPLWDETDLRGRGKGLCATVLAQSGGPQPRTQKAGAPNGAPAPPGLQNGPWRKPRRVHCGTT